MTDFLNTINNTKKEKLVKYGAVFLALLLVFYLYILGSLIGANAQEKHFLGILETEKQKLNKAESLFIAEGKNFHLSFFKELGYEESEKFDLVKTTSNVARITQQSVY